MNVKKFLMATVFGFIVLFLLSWLGHQVIISGMFETSPMAPIERESPLLLGIIAAYLVVAILMAYIYPRGVEGEQIFGNGIRFGIIMGLFISLPISLILYSTLQDVPFTLVISETVWHMIEEGSGGVVIAYTYGSTVLPEDKAEETPVSEPRESPGSPGTPDF